jgi:monofunctional glycosyltransferase
MLKLGKRLLSWWMQLTLLISLFISLGLISFAVLTWLQLPDKDDINGCLVTSMHQIDLCSKNSSYLRLSQVPKNFTDALILSEDGQFWSHNGFDFYELKESLTTNLAKGRFIRGGSTLSQQLAKNMFLNGDKNLWRKVKEALITLQIEKHLNKREILEKYINIVQFGSEIFGLKKAARYYFNKETTELLPEESAFLVMLLPNPKIHSQSFRNKKLTSYANRRIQTILFRMKAVGKISPEDYDIVKQRARWLFSSEAPEIFEFNQEPETEIDGQPPVLDQQGPDLTTEDPPLSLEQQDPTHLEVE